MSYCVHCGVELSNAEKKCPLCLTPVIDPNNSENNTVEPFFPERMDLPKSKVNAQVLVNLFGLALLIPLVAVIIINLLTAHNLTWSLYVLGAEMCLLSLVAMPVLMPHKKPYIYLLANTLTASLYILLICFALNSFEWYLPLGLPITLSVGISAMLITFFCRRNKINKMEKCGCSIIVFSTMLIAIDIFIYHFITGIFYLSWSWYVSFPLLVFSVVLIIISKSVAISEWIKKKVFY